VGGVSTPRPPRDPLQRAAAYLERGPRAAWDAPSRFGPLGVLARRALLRVLRPYAVRQREFDSALLDAVTRATEGVGENIEQPSRAAPPPEPAAERLRALAGALPEGVVEAETAIGTLWLDASDTLITPLIQEHHHWEGDVTAFLEHALRPGMTFVDVGANIGYFSVLGSQLVGAEGRVFSVEPDSRTLAILRANLWRHHGSNASVLPLAAYSETGHIAFTVNKEGRAGSVVAPGQDTGVAVPCARLDDVLSGPVDVLKVDVEQAEHLVIRGAEETIRRNPGLVVVTEFWPGATKLLDGAQPISLLEYYESLGFELCLLRPDGTVDPQAAAEVLQAGVGAPLMNIVLRPRAEAQAASAEAASARSPKTRS
jgi:FkbM family methyltransferase